MQNQPFAEFATSNADAPDFMETSQGRLQLLAVLLVVLALIIGIRVYYIQVVIGERFLLPWYQTSQLAEALPARNGRILSRDGVVLAYDQTRYDLAIDYRWLEVPFDPVWLRKQVYARLSPKERNDVEARQRVEGDLEKERFELFHRLATLTGISRPELSQRAQRLQLRIEKMVTSVESRRAAQNAEEELQPLELRNGIPGVLGVIKSELTTPPRRFGSDPIILKEELEPHVLVEDVPLTTVATIQSSPHAFPGVHVLSHSSRVYPLGDSAAHLIGLRKESSISGDVVGEGGIEQHYNTQLAGQPGRQLHHLNRRGEVISSEIETDPQHGVDLMLTIDSRLQRTAEKLLDRALANELNDSTPSGGVVVVLDIWTGDVLAAAAAPRYSLQTMLHPTEEEFQHLLNHPQQPFFPRVSRMALPPGSVFKLVTAAAALELGEVTPDEVLECRGYLNQPDQHRCMIFRNFGRGHGQIRLDDALCQSCNVFFYDLAQRIGTDALVDWSGRFGFGQPTGIDLPGELAGSLPDPQHPQRNRNWYPGSTLQLAIGQGSLLATPLQVTRMMGAIGNGGYLVTPSVALRSTTSNQAPTRSLQKIPGLNERTLTTLRHGMEMVVHHPQGTGVAALTPSMTIAAKTGTAEVEGKTDHAWFAGMAPVESPRIAFCVVLEHGGAGGDAGPIVKELMTEMIGLGILQPQWNAKSTDTNLLEWRNVAGSALNEEPRE